MISTEKIYEVSDYIGENVFVSSFEIAYLAVDGEIKNGLINDKVKFFMKIFLKKQENISLPHLPWTAEHLEERFGYAYPLRPSSYHLTTAYNRVAGLKIKASIEILLEFLSKANYLAYGVRDEIFATDGVRELRIKVFGSLRDIQENLYPALNDYDILTVPSGAILAPFVDFHRKYNAEIRDMGGYLWNIDLWGGEVNPFIGVPCTDLEEFIPFFGRPRLASVIEQLWPRHRHEPRSISLELNEVSIKVDEIKFCKER